MPKNRARTDQDVQLATPVYAVWEITLACNLKCAHCGSRAGAARPDELSLKDALSLVDQLAELGTREITLIGGEAFLRKDWVEIIRHISRMGIISTMQTGGYGLSERNLHRGFEAGLDGIGVSIDGQEELHDKIRGVPGSYKSAVNILDICKKNGWKASVNTQISKPLVSHLERFYEDIQGFDIKAWQVQLTVPMGNASDNSHFIIQPYEILQIFPTLATLYERARRRGIQMMPGNNIGYFGPYESLWRSPASSTGYYSGCAAGHNGLGIEADGTIKACPSLPKSRYSGGSIKDLPLAEIWGSKQEMQFNRERDVLDLWGFCGSCYYADVCRGGCTWMADSLFGRRGNNPYCHHRALELQKLGIAEEIVKVSEAGSEPFGTGLYKVIEIPLSEAQ